jgi:hypothetical protein
MRSDSEPLFDADVDYGTYTAAHWREIEKSLGFALDAPRREALQDLAGYYAALSRLEPVPRNERIAFMEGLRSRYELAREVLSEIDAATADIDAVLTARIAWVQRWLDQLKAQGGRVGNENAKRQHRKFWEDLQTVWLTLPIEQRTHASLRAFLFACSAPIFDTTPGALTAFTKDHFKPRPRF